MRALAGLDSALAGINVAGGLRASVSSDESKHIAELFRTHGPAVVRRARRLLGSDADADEAAQEIFIRALSGTWAPRGQQSTWLYQITTNYCLNVLRDRGRRAELRDQHLAAPEAAAGAGADDIAMVRRLVARADPREAAAAACVYIEGASHEEAALLLGVSRRTVGNLIDRFCAWAREETGEATLRAGGQS